MIGLFVPRWANTSAALWTMSVGIASFILAKHVFEYEAPFMASLILSVITYVGRFAYVKLQHLARYQDLRSYMPHSILEIASRPLSDDPNALPNLEFGDTSSVERK